MLIPGRVGPVNPNAFLGDSILARGPAIVVFSMEVTAGPPAQVGDTPPWRCPGPPPEQREETPVKKRKGASRSEAAKARGLAAGMGGAAEKFDGCMVCRKTGRDEGQRGAWCVACEKAARKRKFTGCAQLVASKDGLRAVRADRGVLFQRRVRQKTSPATGPSTL